MSNVSWTRKYAPKSTSEILGQHLSVQRLKRFVEEHKSKKARKKSAIIYGVTGSGKTSSIYAIASELGLEVLEINASDFRNAAAINSIVGAASGQMSLFGSGKLILVDELDGISGQKDRGGAAALAKLLAKSAFPIIMTANDAFDKKFSTLRKASEMIEFSPLSTDAVCQVLIKICASEKIEFDESALKSMANRSGGDMRAAINDLQILSANAKLTQEAVDTLSDRNRVESMLTAITKILKTTDFDTAASSFDDINEQPDQWFLWIDENMPAEYRNPNYIAKAYEAISRADVFKGRITRSQYWRFLVYIKLLLTAGVAIAKDEKNDSPAKYKQSSRLLKIWIAKARYGKRKNIAEKIAVVTHTSTKNITNNFHFYKTMVKNSSKLAEELDLDEEEVEWLKK